MTKLYGIGVGPGDRELLTIKAARIIGECPVIIVPSAKDGGDSIALDIAKDYIKEGSKIIVKHFPMGGKEQEGKIFEAFLSIEEELNKGNNVAFLTIGDPFVYSTYIYLLKYIEDKGYDTETVPGITSFCAGASLAGEALVIGDESLLILPGSKVEEIKDEKFVVIMKIFKNKEKILDVLESKNFKFTYIERAGREGQMILRDREEIIKREEYMALIIGRK